MVEDIIGSADSVVVDCGVGGSVFSVEEVVVEGVCIVVGVETDGVGAEVVGEDGGPGGVVEMGVVVVDLVVEDGGCVGEVETGVVVVKVVGEDGGSVGDV